MLNVLLNFYKSKFIWGLGIGDWGLGPIPNPQSPIPNTQTPNPTFIKTNKNTKQKIIYFKI